MTKSMNSSSTEESILHFGLMRLRVTGSGNLLSSLISLNDVQTDQLANLAMSPTTDVEPTLLANFTQQRACWKIETTQIDEVFNISKVIVFVKKVATSYPQ